jgi:plastocyanin domain-containing protein
MMVATLPALIGLVLLAAGIGLSSDALVVLGGLALAGGIAWFFWGPKGGGYRVPVSTSGYQEAMILVKGGYTPDVILVQHGKPVRLNFRREESAACSEMVVFGDFDKSAHLPEGQTVPVEFLPEKPGEYEFACQMGMLRGKLVVE